MQLRPLIKLSKKSYLLIYFHESHICLQSVLPYKTIFRIFTFLCVHYMELIRYMSMQNSFTLPISYSKPNFVRHKNFIIPQAQNTNEKFASSY